MYGKPTGGWIEVICGSMFSGKTEELIRRVRRAQIARQKVQVFKHSLDARYAQREVASHNGLQLEATPVENSAQIRALLEPDTTVVAIDEGQFFDDGIIALCEELADRGLRVIIAGLDLDFRGEPFGPMPQLMARGAGGQTPGHLCGLRGPCQPDPAADQRSTRSLRRPHHSGRGRRGLSGPLSGVPSGTPQIASRGLGVAAFGRPSPIIPFWSKKQWTFKTDGISPPLTGCCWMR